MASASLQGKIIVVCGASSGYGFATAERMFELGAATVIMAMRHAQNAYALADRYATQAVVSELDVRDAAAVHQLVRTTVDRFGRIDAWVNSASVGVAGRFEAVSLSAHHEVIETDLVGTLNASYYALAQFRLQTAGGVLINVAADPDSLNIPYMTSYCAAKFGVVGLSAALRAEAKEQQWKNIHICTVMPGDQIGPTSDQVESIGTVVSPPEAQVAVLDAVADDIATLVLSPRDEVRVMGTHYFL